MNRKPQSQEAKAKQKASLKKAWADGKYANRPSLKGIKRSDETRKKLSVNAKTNPNHFNPFVKGHTFNPKGTHRSPDTEFKKGDPRIPPLARAGRMKQIFPKKATSIELTMRRMFDTRHVNYLVNAPVLGTCQPDISFPDQKVAVFCDGDYWHNLPSYVERDARINIQLMDKEWTVFRFWQHEINEDPEYLADMVMEVMP